MNRSHHPHRLDRSEYMEANMFSPARREQDLGLTSVPNDMQLIEESNAGIKRPADSQLMAIGKKNKRKGLESSDEESITWNSESSHEKSSTEEGKSEMGSDKHLGEIVEEDVMSSDESTDEDIPEHRRRPGVKARFCLVLVYADTFKDGDPVSKHKEFLDETFGDSGASGTYHLARDEVYHLSTSL